MDAKRQLNKSSIIAKAKNEKGIVLVASIALVALLALFGTLGIVTTSTELIISKNHKSSVQARYVAEAGIHRVIGMLNSDPGWIEGIDPANAFSGDNFFGNGTYEVEVFENDPTTGKIRIVTTGNVNGSTTTFEAIVSSQSLEIFDYGIFNCGGFDLKDTVDNEVTGDVFVYGDLNLEESGFQLIQGDAYTTRDIVIGGTSSITGNAFANRYIDLESIADPNVTGTATAGVAVSGAGNAGDKIERPDPVINLCDEYYLRGITINSVDIQAFRTEAFNNGTYIDGNYEYDSDDSFTGFVHITQDFELTANATFSGDVIFIVDGHVDITGSLTSSPPDTYSVIFLVPTGNFKVKGGADVIIDGTLLVGTVYPDGSTTGGDIKVSEEGTNLTVNGNAIAVKGGIDAATGGALVVDYVPLDENSPLNSGSYAMMHWREIRD